MGRVACEIRGRCCRFREHGLRIVARADSLRPLAAGVAEGEDAIAGIVVYKPCVVRQHDVAPIDVSPARRRNDVHDGGRQ